MPYAFYNETVDIYKKTTVFFFNANCVNPVDRLGENGRVSCVEFSNPRTKSVAARTWFCL